MRQTNYYFENTERSSSIPGEPTTYHWHGIVQKNVLFQDGVPNVTQQPIPRDSVFRYNFTADNVGTHFAHSHFGEQRGFGLAGPLIVREANDPQAQLYDYDFNQHIVFVQDIGYNFKSDDPDTLLINGQGVQQNTSGGNPHIFEVEPNKRYRFRIIFNGIINIRVLLWIKDLNMTVIAADGHVVEPTEFASIMMSSAERYDVILKMGAARDEPYWLHARTYGRANLTQIAMIKFRNRPIRQWTVEDFNDNTPPDALQLAWSTFATVSDPDVLSTSPNQLKSLYQLPSNLNAPSCQQIFIEQQVTDWGFQMNNITMSFPEQAFQYQVIKSAQLDESNFCTVDSLNKTRCENEVCSCEHVFKVQQNECYELVIMGPHPFHLHGHTFYVVAEGVAPLGVNITKESVSYNIKIILQII